MPHEPTCGSLFSGAGLLDAGLSLAGWEHAWLCESVPERRDLLRARFPGARVFDDVRTLRGPFVADADAECDPVREQPVAVGGRGGATVAGRPREAATDTGSRGWSGEGRRWPLEPDERTVGADDQGRTSRVTLLAGGFPCKGVSGAGKQNGFEHAESFLWHEMRRVIGEVRPRYVVIENVRDALSIAAGPGLPAGSLWGVVLADLAALGFDVVWDVLPAAAVGAPHLRERVFAVARNIALGGWDAASTAERREHPRRERTGATGGSDRDVAPDTDGAHGQGHGGAERVRAQVTGDHCVGPETPADGARDGEGGPSTSAGANGQRTRPRADDNPSANTDRARADPHAAPGGPRPATSERAMGVGVEWGEYAPAIHRWEAVHGQAPAPLISRFRGVDDGRADVSKVHARLDRSRMRAQRQRLSALGDAVHVYVGQIVGEYVMSLERERLRRAA